MNSEIETEMVSIVKEEADDNFEIKEEPIDEYGQLDREGRIGDLGHFYQVECNAGPEECIMEEEMEPKITKGCSCSKELERLESRMSRLECLLELLVSKVVKSPPIVMSESITTCSVSTENKEPSATHNVASKAAAPLPSIRVATNLMPKTNDSMLAAQSRKGKSLPTEASDFVKAAHTGHLLTVESLLKNNPDIKEVGDALHMAGSSEVVQALCRAHPEIVRGIHGSRALFYAAECGRDKVLRALLDAGADPNNVNRSTLTLLHKAASKGHLECIHALLQKGASVTATTNSNWTALHMAAMNGARECISALVEAGSDINAQDKCGCTPLHYAARWNQLDAIQLLLDEGASRFTKNNRGKTPIDLASTERTLDLLTHQTRLQRSIQTEEIGDESPAYKRLKESTTELPETFHDHNYSALVPPN